VKPGAIGDVEQVLAQRDAQSVFLVADEQAFNQSGARAALREPLADRRIVTFTGFEPNPKLHDLERGLDAFRGSPCDVVLAIGGGTAMDLGKMVAAMAKQNSSTRDIVQGKATMDGFGVPCIAVPTTAGTGSEATHFAVIYVDGLKYSIAHDSLLPNYAVVDPDLTDSLPAPITASSGLDALAQAIESTWSVNSTDQSRYMASQAIRLAMTHLEDAVRCPGPESRLAMAKAAHLAGKAINVSLTTAPHALSYIITSRYGVPHGCAVALTLGAILEYNSQVTMDDCMDPRGPEHVLTAIQEVVRGLGCATAERARDRLTNLQRAVNCPTRLGDVGIATQTEVQLIAEQVNTQRLENNPRHMTPAAVTNVLQCLF